MGNEAIAFIGGGNMTRAIVAGLIDGGYDASNVMIAEPSPEQRQTLTQQFPDAQISAGNVDAANRATTVVLAVKPQVLPDVCAELITTIQTSRPLIVSIAAGVRSSDIDAWLGGDLAVVRVMPNQPALLRLGVTGLFANENTGAELKARASRILSAIGKVVEVPDEGDIDAVTAISGSGPAYFYLLIDMLIESGVKLGLDAGVARTLALETAVGAAALANDSDDEAMSTLIANVRSPGGTTAAALDSLEKDGVRDIFACALTAARDRAVELADNAHTSQD